jgi:hypothetical protein
MHNKPVCFEMVSFSQSFGQHHAVGTLHPAIIRDPESASLGPKDAASQTLVERDGSET